MYAGDGASAGEYWMPPILLRKKYDPDLTGGSNYVDVAQQWHRTFPKGPVPVINMQDQKLLTATRSGAFAVVVGNEMNFPPYYRRWTNDDTFHHAVAVCCYTPSVKLGNSKLGSLWLYDPLGGGPNREPYDGEWISVEDLFGFAFHQGSTIYCTVMSPTAIEDRMIVVTSDYSLPLIARVKANAPIMETPTATSREVTKSKNEQTLPYYGTVAGDDNWASVRTSFDGKTRLAYVHASQLLDVTTNPNFNSADQAQIDKLKAQVKDLTVAIQLEQQRLQRAGTKQAKALVAVNNARASLNHAAKSLDPV